MDVSTVERSEYAQDALESHHRGWIHKTLDDNQQEVFVFASPIHLW